MSVNEARHSEIQVLKSETYRKFEYGDFAEAGLLLDQAHALDFDDKEIQTALKACGFWVQRVESLENLPENGAKGDYLCRQWTIFVEHCRMRYAHSFEEGLQRLKIWVHTEALNFYRTQDSESSYPGTFLGIGRCLKSLGRFEEAIGSFERALRNADVNNSESMAELADTYALIGEMKPAKVLMREALYIDASRIEIDHLTAPVFIRLIERVEAEISRDKGEFNEWLAIYGNIWAVLNVKRELSTIEFGKLKQTIYALRNEIADGDFQGQLRPRLINSYFRLIDHYQSTGVNRKAIQEALINIKQLSPKIYEMYSE